MNHTPFDNLLSIAIERENWELAALCIVFAAVEQVQGLPPEGADALLELLEIEGRRPIPRRGRRCRERRRR